MTKSRIGDKNQLPHPRFRSWPNWRDEYALIARRSVGMKFRVIGERFGVGADRARQIYERALMREMRRVEGDGVFIEAHTPYAMFCLTEIGFQ